MADFERSTTITFSTEGHEINASSMIFFKQIFLECHDLIPIHNDERFDEMLAEYVDKVNKANLVNDLEWWSRHFGVDTQPNWPQFEEYE
jgi:hypothetical protein